MRNIISVALSIIFTISFAAPSFSLDKWDNLMTESARVFEEMTSMPEEGIPVSLLKSCYAIAIIPSAVSGGFVIGGKYGQGVIIAKDKAGNSWSAPAVFNMAGGSFGWQIGGQATDIILLIMSERGLDGILSSKFQLGADAAVSAGPVGRDAQAATDLQLKGGILSYSRSRGLFIGIKLEGAVLSANDKANASIYGKELSPREILITGKMQAPSSAERLMKDLKKF
ncbi:MAG: lipid-binding SYLF domain-containing protein [Candidatus Omnitrophica bacterium]|nr:lipid-binding SYLF domain-containing protein [Candidatus Omnitrophota bacterium]